ncbi:MAG: diacylglycerol kinase family protein [Deltaproteobacteria bacterium]|nr:diacylglycerol kinase family protein [Deltaproteobacteria bacterium]
MVPSTLIVLNPHAHFGQTGRAWQRAQRRVLAALAPAEVLLAEDPQAAWQGAKRAALAGVRQFVVAGCAGTAHGVVNGLMELAESHRKNLGVGFLSLPFRSSWAKTLGQPFSLARQLEILKAGHTVPHDVGWVEGVDLQGNPFSRYFLNGAAFGPLSAYRQGGGTQGLWAPPLPLGVQAAGAGSVRLPLALGLVMVGQFYPGLGAVAPQADPTDGVLALVGIPPLGRWRALGAMAGVGLWGLRYETLLESTGFQVTLEAGNPQEPAPAREDGNGKEKTGGPEIAASAVIAASALEADGQRLGCLPARFAVERHALPVVVAAQPVRIVKPRLAPAVRVASSQVAVHRENT